MIKLSLAVVAAAALVFAGCSAEETPEEKGSTTSNITLPDLSDMPEPSLQEQIDNQIRQMEEGPNLEAARLQQQMQQEQDAMRALDEANRALQEAQDNAARDPSDD